MARPRTIVHTVDREHPDPKIIDEAAALLRRGGLVVFPTETVYGLGAHALDPAAVARIFEAKERPATDPLIVHLASAGGLRAVAREVPEAAWLLAARFWPGALTIILPKQPEVPGEVTAGLDTVAVRVPSHPVAAALLAAADVPVAAPSANLFSRPSPTRASHVLADLEGRVDMVLDAGPTDVGVESTVLDLTVSPPLVRRPGGVSLEALRTVVPEIDVAHGQGGERVPQVSPGQMLRHYAPRARLTLVEGEPDRVRARLTADARAKTGSGRRIGILAPEEDIMAIAPTIAAGAVAGRVLARAYGARRDPDRAARELFDALRTLDEAGVDEILAVALPTGGIGLAIRDRLVRAAEGRIVRV